MKPLNILIAVGDLFFMSKLKTALESQGCAVRVASQASLILKMALGEKPALLILDLGLAGLDPVAIIRELRESPGLVELPVLGYTNHTQVPFWEQKLTSKNVKVVPNSYISSNISNIVGVMDLFSL